MPSFVGFFCCSFYIHLSRCIHTVITLPFGLTGVSPQITAYQTILCSLNKLSISKYKKNKKFTNIETEQ